MWENERWLVIWLGSEGGKSLRLVCEMQGAEWNGEIMKLVYC